jgi:hypothetical protein
MTKPLSASSASCIWRISLKDRLSPNQPTRLSHTLSCLLRRNSPVRACLPPVAFANYSRNISSKEDEGNFIRNYPRITPASHSLSLYANFDEPVTTRLNKIRTQIYPPEKILQDGHTRTSLFAGLPIQHLDLYVKTLDSMTLSAPFHTKYGHVGKKTTKRGGCLHLNFGSIKLHSMIQKMIRRWKSEVRILETDIPTWRPFTKVLFMEQLSDEELEDCFKKMKEIYPKGVEMGKIVSLSLYQRSDMPWAPRTSPDLTPQSHDCYGMKLLQTFPFRGIKRIRIRPRKKSAPAVAEESATIFW